MAKATANATAIKIAPVTATPPSTPAKPTPPSTPAKPALRPLTFSKAQAKSAAKPKRGKKDWSSPAVKAALNADPARQFVTEVVSSGTHRSQYARPVYVEPNSPNSVINNLICRDDDDDDGEIELSPTIAKLQEVTEAFATGKDLQPYKDHIALVTSNQVEKQELTRAYRLQGLREEAATMLGINYRTMRKLDRASRKGDLTTLEALSLWHKANERLAAVDQQLAAEVKPIESDGLTDKLNYAKNKSDQALQDFWKDTTPQGREIMRKRVFTATKAQEAAEAAARAAATKPVEPEVEPTAEELAAEEAAPPKIEVTLAHPP